MDLRPATRQFDDLTIHDIDQRPEYNVDLSIEHISYYELRAEQYPSV